MWEGCGLDDAAHPREAGGGKPLPYGARGTIEGMWVRCGRVAVSTMRRIRERREGASPSPTGVPSMFDSLGVRVPYPT
jgi:hypothetical protein